MDVEDRAIKHYEDCMANVEDMKLDFDSHKDFHPEMIKLLFEAIDALETERGRVQGKLTYICSDIWDAAKRYGVEDTGPDNTFENPERATLRRIFYKLKASLV